MQQSEAQELTPGLEKSLYWSLRLMERRTEVSAIARRVGGINRVAYGFLDPQFEEGDFGVILMASGEASKIDSDLPSLVVDTREFPVRVRRVMERFHRGGIPQPTRGSAGIRARSRATSATPIGPGVLTAKHVLGTGRSGTVSMSCGCTGTVADVAPNCIDCALLTCGCPIPSMARVRPWMAVPGSTTVEFHGRGSGLTISTHVTATTDILHIYDAPELPITLMLALAGTTGDSGAAVFETVSAGPGAPVGLYLGDYYQRSSGMSGGLAHHAGQLCEVMDMELLR